LIARIAIFICLGFAFVPAHADDAVRVLLSEEKRPIEFQAHSPVELSTGQEKIFLNHPKSHLKIEFIGSEWVIRVKTKNYMENYKLSGKTLSLSSLTLQWKENKMTFPVRISYTGKYSLVGVMGMNRYLRGVVAHEMPGSWPLEALKAQVVASRTYALWKKHTQHNDIYDLRPSVLDQVFRLDRTFESSSLPPSVETALKETEDMYLTDQHNRIIKAYFHSDCGGATSSAEEVWGQSGSGIKPTRDITCASRSSSWTSKWNLSQLRSRFMGEFVLPANLKLLDVVIRTQSESQRVEWVDLIFSKGIFKRVRGEDLRRMLGYEKIRSTLFAVKRIGETWIFNGRGFGHGVGMCQHGARAMAKNGSDFKTILSHYYPGSILKNGTRTTPQSVSSLFEPIE
jgi:stage II sporulation protein D